MMTTRLLTAASLLFAVASTSAQASCADGVEFEDKDNRLLDNGTGFYRASFEPPQGVSPGGLLVRYFVDGVQKEINELNAFGVDPDGFDFTFNDTGNHSVRASVLFTVGGQIYEACKTTTVTVQDAPVAEANGPYSGIVGSAVTFSGAGSTVDSQNSVNGWLTYGWNFGDGGAGTGSSPQHTYATHGTFNVTLTVNDGAYSDPDTATATITGAAVKFSFPVYTRVENFGNPPKLTITVQRTGNATIGTSTVHYATSNGTAIAGSDYYPVSGDFTWTGTDYSNRTFDVELINDPTAEPDEYFNVVLSSPGGTAGTYLGTPSTATVEIPCNDNYNCQ